MFSESMCRFLFLTFLKKKQSQSLPNDKYRSKANTSLNEMETFCKKSGTGKAADKKTRSLATKIINHKKSTPTRVNMYEDDSNVIYCWEHANLYNCAADPFIK